MKSASQILDGIAVDVEYEYFPSTSDYFDSGFGNYLPGDSGEVNLKHIWLSNTEGQKIDLLPFLPNPILNKLEDDLFDDEENTPPEFTDDGEF